MSNYAIDVILELISVLPGETRCQNIARVWTPTFGSPRDDNGGGTGEEEASGSG